MNTPRSMPHKPRLHILSRRLTHLPDPLTLFSHLRAAAPKLPRALFETADRTASADAQSLIYVDTAVSCQLAANQVVWEPLSANGRHAIQSLIESGWTGGAQGDSRQGVIFPLPVRATDLDEETRLNAPSPLDPLRSLVWSWSADPRALESVHAFGTFAYDFVDRFEPLPPRASADRNRPDYAFYLCESRILIDHSHGTTTVTTVVFGDHPPPDLELSARRRLSELEQVIQDTPGAKTHSHPRRIQAQNYHVVTEDADFARTVAALKKEIDRGEVFQIVPSRRFETICPDPLKAYAELRSLNPSPYMFYLEEGVSTLFGASPESALKIRAAEHTVEIRPIAGTRGRALNPDGSLDVERDSRLELELRLNTKELAEHAMLIDLARNDVARVSEPGSRTVPELMAIERYSHVMHLVSRVRGKLRAGLDALHAYQASLNMGTLTGAPKIRAMQILRKMERYPRGPYGGAVGYLDALGNLDTAIVIRSAWVEDSLAWVQAGCGVVADSDPIEECHETRRKAEAVLAAITQAREGTSDAS
ncbi:MAG: anthranilate synthase component 1 [Gammaproteobacteria bacterium]